MKYLYFLTLFLFLSMLSIGLLAQNKSIMQRTTLEVGGGYATPLSPNHDIVALSDYAGINNFYLGARFELNDLIGLRFTYGNTSFADKNDSSMGLTHHKLMAEGTLNIIEMIDVTRKSFEVIVHGGAGLSFGKSKQSSGIDKMGTLQVGVMPLYRFTNNFAVHIDFLVVANQKQNFFYDGGPSNPDNSHVSGQYFMVDLGVAYSF